MKDLPSKEHYPYKILTLLMKNSACPTPSIEPPPPSSFLQKNLSMIFSKIPTLGPPYK